MMGRIHTLRMLPQHLNVETGHRQGGEEKRAAWSKDFGCSDEKSCRIIQVLENLERGGQIRLNRAVVHFFQWLLDDIESLISANVRQTGRRLNAPNVVESTEFSNFFEQNSVATSYIDKGAPGGR